MRLIRPLSGVHQQLAQDTWRLIKALVPEVPDPEGDLDAAALLLIEMACDSAAESAKMALLGPRGLEP